MPDCPQTTRHADARHHAPDRSGHRSGSGSRLGAWPWPDRAAALRSWLRLVNGRLPERLASFLLALTLAIGLPELLARGFLAA